MKIKYKSQANGKRKASLTFDIEFEDNDINLMNKYLKTEKKLANAEFSEMMEITALAGIFKDLEAQMRTHSYKVEEKARNNIGIPVVRYDVGFDEFRNQRFFKLSLAYALSAYDEITIAAFAKKENISEEISRRKYGKILFATNMEQVTRAILADKFVKED